LGKPSNEGIILVHLCSRILDLKKKLSIPSKYFAIMYFLQ